MNKPVNISFKAYLGIVGAYLIIPIIVFFLGYLKLPIGILLSLAVAALLVLAIRDCNSNPDGLKTDHSLAFPIKFLIISAVFALIVTVLSGVGEFVWSTYDHAFRRATMNDLVSYSWPIVYDPSTQTNPEVIEQMTSFEPQGFVYYLTFWMIPAVVGKIAGITAANIALVIWTAIGITLILMGTAFYIKKTSYAIHFVYLVFAGIDAIPFVLNQCFFHIQGHGFWLDGCMPFMAYVSNFVQLQDVFNQAVPSFLILLLLLIGKNNRSTGTVASLIFAYSPWATLGMLVPAFIQLLRKENLSSDKKQNLKNVLGIGNIAMPIVMLLVYGSFYLSKKEVTSIKGFTFTFYDSLWLYILAYIVLIVIEVLPSAGLVFSQQKKNPLFWGAVITLLLLPLYRVTKANDFIMRCSMPALACLSLFLTKKVSGIASEDKKLFAEKKKRTGLKANLKLAVLSFILVLMSFVAAYKIYIVISAAYYNDMGNPYEIGSFGDIYHPGYYYEVSSQFFVPDYEDTFFFKYLAK